MRRCRRSLVPLLLAVVLGAALIAIPAAALASGGGSAGDQQYTDPFAATPKSGPTLKHVSSTTTPAPTATSAPAPTAAAPATAVASATASASTPVTMPATTSTMSSHPPQLAYTGYDEWLAGALGVALAGAGFLMRRRIRGT